MFQNAWLSSLLLWAAYHRAHLTKRSLIWFGYLPNVCQAQLTWFLWSTTHISGMYMCTKRRWTHVQHFYAKPHSTVQGLGFDQSPWTLHHITVTVTTCTLQGLPATPSPPQATKTNVTLPLPIYPYLTTVHTWEWPPTCWLPSFPSQSLLITHSTAKLRNIPANSLSLSPTLKHGWFVRIQPATAARA